MKDLLKAVVFGGLFAVPLLTLYVENDYFFPFITGKNFWFRILVDVTFAAWILLTLHEIKYRPKVSGIVWSFGVLLVIMFVANSLGVHPQSSFWSNFERMDGYVSLVHTFLYMLVLGSVLQTKQMWQRFLNVSLVVAFAVGLYGLAQYGGLVDGSSRIESRLGNAAYMAIYMLFHIFIAFWLFVESKNQLLKIGYGALAVMFTFILIETGTRGTAVGLAVGVFVMAAYIGLFGKQFVQYRKYAVGAFILLVVAVSAFIAGRDTELVQSNPNLSRIANISIDDLRIRGIIWGVAWEGVKEKPLLGYGQSNFNFVFNGGFDPRLYAQEQWFDRTHDIFLDWLVAGGFLGLIAYLSIFGWCLYYLFVKPLIDKKDESFDVLERGILLGILAGYFTHNLVVFDNIVSYIFFAIILALINSRVGLVPKAIAKVKVDRDIISQFATPVTAVLLVAVIYFFHTPGMQAAGDVIDALRTQDPAEQLNAFERALERRSFAYQEITEQFAQRAMSVVRDTKIPEDVRQEFATKAEAELLRMAEWKPGDARIHVFIGSYYRSLGDLNKAAEQLAVAREFSPRKQAIIEQQGFVALTAGKPEEARDFFKEAYELDTNNLEALEYYTGSLLYTKERVVVDALMADESEERREKILKRLTNSKFLAAAANDNQQFDLMIKLYEERIKLEPEGAFKNSQDPQNWASLAYLYYKAGTSTKAISVLEDAKEKLPQFATTAGCFIENLKNGKEPQEGCQ